MAQTTIFSMLQEMQSFVHIDKEDLEKAKVSKITFHNHSGFKELVQAWLRGDYDEDPEILAQSLTALL